MSSFVKLRYPRQEHAAAGGDDGAAGAASSGDSSIGGRSRGSGGLIYVDYVGQVQRCLLVLPRKGQAPTGQAQLPALRLVELKLFTPRVEHTAIDVTMWRCGAALQRTYLVELESLDCAVVGAFPGCTVGAAGMCFMQQGNMSKLT